MAEGDEKKQTIIIVKKKGGHAGAHGGAWKVAYADLVTALMAFFLLMWLLNSLSKDQKEALSDYFKNFSIFTEGGHSWVPKKASWDKPGEKQEKQRRVEGIDTNPGAQQAVPFETYSPLTPKEFVDQLQKTVESRLSDLKNQIKIDITEDGVRIQLVDRDGKDMFQAGASRPSAICQRALGVIAESFRELSNPIAIEGHTDSLGQNDGPRGNWWLSTERALAARELLEQRGVDADQFRRVTGKADTDPFVPDDTEDSQNRRVAITLLFPKSSGRDAPAPPDGRHNEDEGGAAPSAPEPTPGHESGGASPTHGGGH